MDHLNETPDKESLELLVENHRRFLAFLRPRTKTLQDAEEILQSAYLKAVDNEESLDEETAVAWFYRLLRNALIGYYRRQEVEARAVAQLHESASNQADKDDEELERTICECFRDLLPTLRPEYAELLKSVDLGGSTVAGAAAALGITPNNASVRLHRARLALKTRLEQLCRTCAIHGCLDCNCKSC